MIHNSNIINQNMENLNTILKSTCSGKSNYHIGEKWIVGRKEYEIISYFDRDGVRYYIGETTDNTPLGDMKFFHIIYKYKGKWTKYC